MQKLTVKQQANRIVKIYNQATEEEKTAGVNWYETAYKFCRDISNRFDITIDQAAQLVALLSPQCSWLKNMVNVEDFLKGETDSIFATKKQLSECENVVDHNWQIPTNRRKTWSFAQGIIKAGSTDICTIDRHAIKICFGQMSPKEISITDKRYREAQAAYKLASTLIDTLSFTACELQAITWVTYKRIVNR